MKTSDLCEKIEYRLLQGSMDTEVTDVIYDSRKVTEGTMFVCMVGAVTDGHKYIPDAVEKGAGVIVAEREEACKGVPPEGHGDLSGVGASCTGISVGSILRLSCKEADDHWSDGNKRENHNDIYHTGCSAAGRAKGRVDRNYRNGHRRDFYPCQEYDAGIL